jgi:phosphoribosylglycinamide formyltransferase-1
VDEFLDAGPIVLQKAVPVLDDDTVDSLSARILQEEHRIYSQAIRIMLGGNFRIAGRRVVAAANRS